MSPEPSLLWGPLPADTPYWSAEADDCLRCVQVRVETHDVKTFVFAGLGADGGRRRFHYLPGQFGLFEFRIDGVMVNRCYTWSSSPTRPDTVSITVKRVPGGVVSHWLHEHLLPGVTLQALGPSGVFSCFDRPIAPYLFVSGGSGITPLMSMTRALHDLPQQADVVFVHCARTPDDLVFAAELDQLAHNMPSLRLLLVCEERTGQLGWPGVVGRLDLGKLQALVPDFKTRQTYTCGPPPFMTAVRAMLQAADYDMAQYAEESFDFATLQAGLGEEAAGGEAEAKAEEEAGWVAQLQSGREFTCLPSETLLQAAKRAGLRWPFSCANGMCGTCKVKLLSGQVDMQHNGGIRQRDINAGWILPCCSRPLSHVVIER
ncbi:MAG: hybrid-cluster NAD(P)-dependent oxidoreductase [Neisseriaceae bacterium]|nr:hybrid-cluster NAD(P)-dependent oxidoreductase [Neisseriaceae bacterium]